MAMFCRYCREQMTSAPSHMDHERACSKNPANEVVGLRAKAARLAKALASIGRNTCGREPLAAAYARGVLAELAEEDERPPGARP